MSLPQLALKQPVWFSPPVDLCLPFERSEAGPFGEELAVEIHLGRSNVSAFVPRSAVDADKSCVRCQAVGQTDQDVYVAFPPTSLGGTTGTFNRADIDAYLPA